MKVISNAEFGGERPLFESHDLRLENVIIRAGESAIKECSNIEAVDCRFEGNYPFWHVHGFVIDRCFFDVGGRTRGAVVFAQPYDERHAGRSPQDVPRDARHRN